MAMGPEEIRSARQKKIAKLEEIIDEKIRDSESETVRIDSEDIPGIRNYFSEIKTMHENAGWYDVTLDENYYETTLVLRSHF